MECVSVHPPLILTRSHVIYLRMPGVAGGVTGARGGTHDRGEGSPVAASPLGGRASPREGEGGGAARQRDRE